MEPVGRQKNIHMSERLTGPFFSKISERQSVQADIVDFSYFAVISLKRCKGIILGSKSREFSFFHAKLFLLCGEMVNVDKYEFIQEVKYEGILYGSNNCF